MLSVLTVPEHPTTFGDDDHEEEGGCGAMIHWRSRKARMHFRSFMLELQHPCIGARLRPCPPSPACPSPPRGWFFGTFLSVERGVLVSSTGVPPAYLR
jgi:hypothetical protein